MRTRYPLVIAGLILAGCGPERSAIMDRSSAQDVADNLIYVQDKRTKLCYGVTGTNSAAIFSFGSITVVNVPCEAVKDLLGK